MIIKYRKSGSTERSSFPKAAGVYRSPVNPSGVGLQASYLKLARFRIHSLCQDRDLGFIQREKKMPNFNSLLPYKYGTYMVFGSANTVYTR
jgi:hypothetical protein